MIYVTYGSLERLLELISVVEIRSDTALYLKHLKDLRNRNRSESFTLNSSKYLTYLPNEYNDHYRITIYSKRPNRTGLFMVGIVIVHTEDVDTFLIEDIEKGIDNFITTALAYSIEQAVNVTKEFDEPDVYGFIALDIPEGSTYRDTINIIKATKYLIDNT